MTSVDRVGNRNRFKIDKLRTSGDAEIVMRRTVVKTTVVLAILLLVATVASYLLLLTALPGRWILATASTRLGLNVTAESLSVGWMGRTRIRDVKVTMPLSDDEILTAAEIELDHRALPWLLLTRSLGLGTVQIDSPSLHVHRADKGHWNVQDVWTRIEAGRRTDDPASRHLALPKIEVRDATVHITDANGTAATMGPLTFAGRPQGHARWAFTLQTRPHIEAQGQLAQGHDWTHTVGFDIKGTEPLLKALSGPNVAPLEIAGRWEGRLVKGALAGRLDLDRLRLGKLALVGTVGVTAGPDGVTLRPSTLALSEPKVAGAPVHCTGGLLHVAGDEIRAEQLGLQAGAVSAALDGRWSNVTRTGAVTGSWLVGLPGADSGGRGTCQVNWRAPTLGHREAEVKLTAQLETARGHGNITANLLGTGQTWQDSEWELSAPTFAWTNEDKHVALSGAEAHLELDWPQVQLTALHLPNARQVQADAQFHATTGQWSAQVDVDRLRGEPWEDEPLEIHFAGTGDRDRAAISALKVTQGPRTMTAQGEISLADRRLGTVHISAQWPVATSDTAAQTTAPERGFWHSEADITGRAWPLELKVSGVLAGSNVPLGRQVVHDVNIPIAADIDAERIAITTEPFTLLDGRWRVSGRHEWSNTLTQLSLVLDELSLKSAADMAGSPLACQGQVKAELELAAPGFRLPEAVAFGSWSATEVKIASLEAEAARGKIRIANGLVRFDAIRLDQDAGWAEGHMQFRLDRPQLLSLNFETTDWPIQWKPRALAVRLDGTADAQLDVLAKTINGQGRLSGDVVWETKELGRMTLATSVRERTLTVQEFRAEALGGTIEGTAQIPLDQWTSSTGRMQWQGIEPNALEPWWPSASRIRGELSGTLLAAQAQDERRPPEPMRLDLKTEMPGGRIGTAELRDGRIVAYLGPRRFLIDQADFHVLGGRLEGRARVSPHVEKLYTTVVMDMNDIDLNQLVHVINPDADQIAGRLAGHGNLLFSSDLSSFSGQADLNLSQSDLAKNGVVRTLYNAMNLNLGSSEPKGAGQMRIQLDGVRTSIPSFVYFNRGVEIRGAGEIENFRLGSASPIDGYAFGSTRVLKGIPLPGVKELDRLMSSLQSGVASVEIGGTLAEPKAGIVPLPSLSDPLRRLLWTQLRSGQQSRTEP